jgi:hypothetical protein
MLNFSEMFSKTHIVANIRSWSFIMKSSKETVLVSSVMQSYSIAWYEAAGQAKWLRNLYPKLILVVNSNNHLSSLIL